jgi:hypothetical protein
LLAIIKNYLAGVAALSGLTADVSVAVAVVSVSKVVLSTVDVDVVVSADASVLSSVPSPHAAKAPIANTKRSFFIVPVFCFKECLVLIPALIKGNPHRSEKS